jgi:hypothetical protein
MRVEMTLGDSPVPLGYRGQDIPESTVRFLQDLLNNHEFSVKESGSARKTLKISWNDIRFGYVNSTVISHKAVVGYSFYANKHTTDACPHHLIHSISRYFREKYRCSDADIIHFDGKGSNTGKTYSMIASRAIALHVFMTKAESLASL